ncbi:elongation factor P hydroxylase [Psychrobacter sp. TAE2020]|uniref:elongation factor P hydroxylase n=1 Tax=Psychrobacter sp. TAE2020 TaxID=2846762 RepID=UPI001C0F901E|nr:elongation factor P hydroxylase [Psychrobacter sp. TAE2020]MBU5616565.1 elongation factor P hydroxylase [Psychrobacter sp. TAE2020]
MLLKTTTPDFAALLTSDNAILLLKQLHRLADTSRHGLHQTSTLTDDLCLCPAIDLKLLATHNSSLNYTALSSLDNEPLATDWLIEVFNALFVEQNVQLVRGDDEPEYFPATASSPARIEFAHGFFASALHEISHWCVAGHKRRLLSDFGYWYAADGRSQSQQQAFESVEIKPQALECLFTIACQRPFKVSQDNLFASFDTSASTFANDVYKQAEHYIANPQTLPRDAQTLLAALLMFQLES